MYHNLACSDHVHRDVCTQLVSTIPSFLGSQLEAGTMDLEQEPTILRQGMMCIHLKIELINDKNR